MKFEWDKNKNKSNYKKHGISFELIKILFEGESSIYVPAKVIEGEERIAVIGVIEEKVYVCIHVVRGETIRIISARRARANEEVIWLKNQ